MWKFDILPFIIFCICFIVLAFILPTFVERLILLADVYIQYQALRAEQEKTLEVKVSSYDSLTAEQQQKLSQSLSQRLQREITLNVTIDKSLLGGAIIQAGDLVIDGSVRGKLNKLRTSLAA
jgi:F-type H+-transporting ATPase subunit delta